MRSILRFETPPDKIFTAILEESIKLMIDRIKEIKSAKEDAKNELEYLLPSAGKVYGPATALKTLKRILACHKRPGLYRLNDYHYLLLYDTLQYFCEIHNDMVKEARSMFEKKRMSRVGAFCIERINFDDLIDIYFYDTDFLMDGDTLMTLGLERRKELGLNDETFGISQGLAPHPDELKINVQNNEKPLLIIKSRFWGPGSSVYPDLKINKEYEQPY
jgi:hypothetical protein